MKRTLLFILAASVALPDQALGQYALRSASGSSGLLLKGDATALNYSFTQSRLGFTMMRRNLDSLWIRLNVSGKYNCGIDNVDSNGKQKNPPETLKFYYSSFRRYVDLGMAGFQDKALIVLNGANINPSWDIAVTLAWTRYKENCLQYGTAFIRPSLKVSKSIYAFPADAQGNAINLEQAQSTDLALAVGGNWAFTDDLVLGISLIGIHSLNTSLGLTKRTVCTSETNWVSSDEEPTTVADCENRYWGAPDNKYQGQIRADFFYRPKVFKKKDKPSIGILGAISVSPAEGFRPAWNISLGPSVHAADSPNTTLFAVLFEFIDMTNSLGNSENIGDIFQLRAYIGVPLDSFKIN